MGRMTTGTNVAQLFETIAPRATPEDVRIAEAMVFASAEPLEELAIAARLSAGANVAAVMEELRGLYAGRGINLCAGSRGAGRSAPPATSPGCSRGEGEEKRSFRAPRSRPSPSSPIISRSHAPT